MGIDLGKIGGLVSHGLPVAAAGFGVYQAGSSAAEGEELLNGVSASLGKGEDITQYSTVSQIYQAVQQDATKNSVIRGAANLATLAIPGGMLAQILAGFGTDAALDIILGKSPQEIEDSMKALGALNSDWEQNHRNPDYTLDPSGIVAVLKAQMDPSNLSIIAAGEGLVAENPNNPDAKTLMLQKYDESEAIMQKAQSLANALNIDVKNIGYQPMEFIIQTMHDYDLPPSILAADTFKDRELLDSKFNILVHSILEKRQAQQVAMSAGEEAGEPDAPEPAQQSLGVFANQGLGAHVPDGTTVIPSQPNRSGVDFGKIVPKLGQLL